MSQENLFARGLHIGRIADALASTPHLKGAVTVESDKLGEAIVEKYSQKKPYFAELYGISGELDNHKVAALVTLLVFDVRPLRPVDPNSTNAYVKIANHLLAIHSGFSLLAPPSQIPANILTSLIQQLDAHQATLLSLASQYYMLSNGIKRPPLPA